MGKQVESPRHNVISLRVSDEERDSLERVASRFSMSISEIMRRSLLHIRHQHESGQLQQTT